MLLQATCHRAYNLVEAVHDCVPALSGETMLHIFIWLTMALWVQAVPGLWLCLEPALKSSPRLFC